MSSDQLDVASNTDLSVFNDTSSSLPASIVKVSAPKAVAKKAKTTAVATIVNRTIAVADITPGNSETTSTKEIAPTQNVILNNSGALLTTTTTYVQASTSLSPPSSSCLFPGDASSPTRKIIFNEIAWMGSPSSSKEEWIELKNISGEDIDLSGWRLLDATGKIKLDLGVGDDISRNGFFVVSHGSSSIDEIAGSRKIYSGDLVNGGDTLALIDAQCVVSDYIDAPKGWPAGDNTTKQTLERDANGIGWHKSTLPGGTPGVENSAGPPPVQYKLMVAFEGDAPGTITSIPAGLFCNASCTGSFASGTPMVLTPVPGGNSVFKGWSGMCYGQTACSLTVGGNISITADFRALTPLKPPVMTNPISIATSTIITATSTSFAAPNLFIEAVQIGGASSTNDLVRIYNPATRSIDISGWKLHKRSQSGTDYSVKQFPAESIVGAGGIFVWANGLGGFSETVHANVSSTETLSADNSVALLDSDGNIIDGVAWGTGTGQYGGGSPYPTSPGVDQMLVRRSVDGVMVDSKNDASDFMIK
jgi:hypothetical protein